MFSGFGLVALSKAYDKYIEEHIPVIKSIIARLKEKEPEGIIIPINEERPRTDYIPGVMNLQLLEHDLAGSIQLKEKQDG